MAGPKNLIKVDKVCFYCSLKVPDKTSLALHYVREHWEEVRTRQGQTYRPMPESLKAGNILAPQPTSRQGGTVRRVSVMSADDERRMAMRKEMLAAKRAQMPPQKIKLVYTKPNIANEKDKKIAKLGMSWDVVNEEIRKRQKFNMNVPTSAGLVEVLVNGDGDVAKQSESSDEKDVNNSQGDGEVIEMVGKMVGVVERQEVEFDEEAVVEDELLAIDVAKLVGGDTVKEASGKGETSCSKSGTPFKATSPSSSASKATSPSNTPPTYGFTTPSPSLEKKRRALSSLIISNERKAGPREERPFSTRVTEEIALGDFGKEKHCEVKLVKLDKVHLLKASQGEGGDEGLISHGIEDLEVETKRCDIKLPKLDMALLMSTKLPSVEIGGAIEQAKVHRQCF